MSNVEIFTIGYGGKKPKDFFKELEALQPCLVVDVRRDPNHAFLGVYTRTGLASRLPHYEWIPELGNKQKCLPPEYVNEEVGFAKLRVLISKYPRIVLLCAEKDENRCHRKWIKEKILGNREESGLLELESAIKNRPRWNQLGGASGKEFKDCLDKIEVEFGKHKQQLQNRDWELASDIYEALTNGWSEHEKSHWDKYLEEEVKPFWADLYNFLKKNVIFGKPAQEKVLGKEKK